VDENGSIPRKIRRGGLERAYLKGPLGKATRKELSACFTKKACRQPIGNKVGGKSLVKKKAKTSESSGEKDATLLYQHQKKEVSNTTDKRRLPKIRRSKTGALVLTAPNR